MAKKLPLLIGICGYKQSGKDTISEWLSSQHGYVPLSFAKPLKKICADLFDIPMSVFEDGALKETIDPRYNMTPRDILIRVGTDCFRAIKNDVWTEYAFKEADRIPYNIVISDVRFQNEADAVLARGGTLIRVVRSGYEKGKDIGDIDFSATPHCRIDNDRDIEALQCAITDLLIEVAR